MAWEYTSIRCDTWLPIGVQAQVKAELESLGAAGWEAFGVTPPTPPPGEGDDPDLSSYDVLLKRQL